MKQQPNIVFFLVDDLGWNDLAAEGSSFHNSPNIDRIADGGVRFAQGYAPCQVCSPSRASILTGQYPPRHGITDWIGAPSGEAWREQQRHTKMLPPTYERNGLRQDTVTFAQLFRDQGYRTFFAGKWHLGDGESNPENFGFEINKGGWAAGSPVGGYFPPYKNPKLEDGPQGESLPLRLAGETVQFIERHQDEPFLAYLSFYSVHGPIQTNRERWAKYRTAAAETGDVGQRFVFDRRLPVRQVQDCPIYGGMVEAMDDAVGLVLDGLERLGLTENTIICFTSDNGGVSSGDCYSTSNLPLRGGKGRQWEGGIRVPVYIKAPGITKPGTTCDTPVSGIDFYPTLLELCGMDRPQQQPIDGLSLVPLLNGQENAALHNRMLFWHYPHYGNQGGDPSSIIRHGHWKLIYYYENHHSELYNLVDDPGEQQDLCSEHPKITQAMKTALDAWLSETGAKFPVPDPERDSAKEQSYLDTLQYDLMPKLEKEHADYLNPNWKPNADWWQSQIVHD